MATRTEVAQLESRMDTEDYRKLQGLFLVGEVICQQSHIAATQNQPGSVAVEQRSLCFLF